MKNFALFWAGIIFCAFFILSAPFERNQLISKKENLIKKCEKDLPRNKNCIIVMKAIVMEKK